MIEAKIGKVIKTGFESEDQELKHYMETLMYLCDSKQEDGLKMILGYKATPLQLERYKDKYERAKRGEFDNAKNRAVIHKFEAMNSSIRQFIDVIEEYRGFVGDLFQAGKLEKVKEAIEAGWSFKAETIKADVEALLGRAVTIHTPVKASSL